MEAFAKIQGTINNTPDYGHAKRNKANKKYLKKIQGKSFADVLAEEEKKLNSK